MSRCGYDRTPLGWWCSREKYHEGPCAAWPKGFMPSDLARAEYEHLGWHRPIKKFRAYRRWNRWLKVETDFLWEETQKIRDWHPLNVNLDNYGKAALDELTALSQEMGLYDELKEKPK